MKSDRFSKVHLEPLKTYTFRNQVTPYDRCRGREFISSDFTYVVRKIQEAHERGSAVVAFVGSQVLEEGLGLYIIQMVRDGWITHVATTGAGAQYDVQAALTGWTGTVDQLPQDLPRLGMWQEIGDVTVSALQAGAMHGLGYGESLGYYLMRHQNTFPYIAQSVLWKGYQAGIPITCHPTIGADEIHTNPGINFRVLGQASGWDFQGFCHSISKLEGGVFLNIGSQVTGVEVFLKALSIVRNLGYTVEKITTANFDWIVLGDYHRSVGYKDWDYYYRPRKNVVHRPTSLGGKGFHFEGEHRLLIPSLLRQLNIPLEVS